MTVGIDLTALTSYSIGFPLNAAEWNSRNSEYDTAFGTNTKDIAIRQNILTMTTGENITLGDALYVSGATILKTDDSDAARKNFIGFALETIASGNPCKLSLNAVYGLSGLTSGALYYLSATAGAITTTAPNTYSKAVGYALSTTTFFIKNVEEETPTFSSATIIGDLTVGTHTLFVDSANNRVGFGTASPNSTLEVNAATPILEIKASTDTLASLVLDSGATSDGVILFDLNNSTRWAMGLDASDAESFVLAASGGLGSSNRFKVNASGHAFFPNLRQTGAATNIGIMGTGEIVEDTSSIKFKENVTDLKSDSKNLLKVFCCTYNRIGSDIEEPGIIAEHLEKIMPEFVGYKNGKPHSIRYDKLTVPLIHLVQRHDAKINELINRIAVLEG